MVTLNQIMGRKVEYDEAVNGIKKGFQKTFPGNWLRGKLSNEEEKLSKEFAKSALL